MRLFHHPLQSEHAPERELHNGDWVPFAECPERFAQILAACGGAEVASDHGAGPILSVHDAGYVRFLEQAHGEWVAAGRKGDAIGYTFPVVRRRPLEFDRIDAKLGAWSMDASTPIASGTWNAAYWSAQGALSALDAVAAGERRAFALCRPPGHHAGADYMGGYCYLNNAAIAARAAGDRGMGRVAILDVDYHHGNGTQDIFYASPDVFFASIHADPVTDYPFYWGHADERGEGEGEGSTLNLPLPRGTDWTAYAQALDAALGAIGEWGADMLVLSFGADTFAGDPISSFALQTDDFARMGERIAQAGLPTVIVMEGGYAVDDLGTNVATFLDGISR
ncbi:Deacetylase, including histone deacetylase and acetoin utilization protein [Altererythrobacter epoxidivorans]|uniref:Deacetylase, including histone deacetylase and acetoin utilization protein n=1 Tax=Altererythrobacter epoxidivorans TaxID=361183 RepID=A0A0M4MW64_9SPHN|nr:histone deacetylase family protein [Altererythrobacter epoxidivorans]ALE18083.1 Deacetylase, including histone deacetylase and acetoin utilization protein [Altererythrobacter epoxidivorans]